jgi:type IV pilus assembly protein PilY1
MILFKSGQGLMRVSSALLGLLATLAVGTSHSAAAPTPIPISQLPLTVSVPAHPQIVIAIGNSESMDGNLGGAIMAGSGSLPSTDSLLQSSSSPLNFTIPAGFTPPLNPGAAGSAPYTVTVSGHLADNSPSRLNVAKAGLTAVLNQFMPNADFALMDYQTSGTNLYTTWLYEMSPTTSGFVFTNTQVAGNRYTANPCYNYTSLATTNPVYQNCSAIAGSGQVTGTMSTSQYMQISASSDDPLINDVLYAGGGIAAVCLVYGGPSPSTPYPPSHTLAQYVANPGNIAESYSHQINGCAPTTTPTNAGFVPFTPQTMYIQRGFGYGGGQSATTAATLVPMTSAGAVPTPSSVATAIAKFTPFLAPETNTTATTEIKASGGQSALPGLLAGANNYYATQNPPSSNGCKPQRYVVLLTDGLPTLDLSGGSWPPPGTTSANAYGVTVAFNADGSLDTTGTNDKAVTDTIAKLTALASAANPIKTYVIGLGAGVDPTQNPVAAKVLKAMAVAGGTGDYFPATSPTALTNDMQVILAKILATSESTAATSVNTTELRAGSVAYLGQFTTADTLQDWTGDLHAFPLDPTTGQVNTNPSAALWSARAKLDAENWDTDRLIATWDPGAKKGTPFRWDASLVPNGISTTTPLGLALSTFASDPNGQDVLQFLRGGNSQEVRNGGQFRNRTHKLGDIVDSAATYVGQPSGFSQTTAYASFVRSHATRAPVLYVGANDGMLHAFDAATGNEKFAYIPNGVFNNLISLANPYYNQNHLFFVDATPQAADVQFPSDSSWHTLLVGGEGAGGNTLYALDVTNGDSFTTEAQVAAAARWEFTDSDMGLTYSVPTFASTSVNATSSYAGWLVFVGNGYNSTRQKPFLYALNPETGAMVAKVDLCAAVTTVCNASLPNGLSSVTAVNSFGQPSAPADTVYAGDLQGNLWRVDITNSTPTSWVVKVIYQARDSSGNIQPITTAPAVALNQYFPGLLGDMVEFGTGQLLGLSDLSNTSTQSLSGINDAPTTAAPPSGFSGIPTRSNLVKQTVTTGTANGQSVLVENAAQPVTLPTNRGWYIDMTVASGMRMVTDPKIEAGGVLVLTTYQPNTDPCKGGGSSWLFALNYATGGSFPLPQLDLNGDGVLNSTDQTSTGLNPVALSLGPVFASSVTLVSGKCTGNACGHKLTSVSSLSVTSVGDRGGGSQRVGWWEVRH